jgi:hypothetical protein
MDDRTKEFVAVMTGRASHARRHGFHEAADLMVNMVQLVSRGLPRLPVSLFPEEVSCPGPTREGEEEEKGEGEEEEEEEVEEEEAEVVQETVTSHQAADQDSIWEVKPDQTSPTKRLRSGRCKMHTEGGWWRP